MNTRSERKIEQEKEGGKGGFMELRKKSEPRKTGDSRKARTM